MMLRPNISTAMTKAEATELYGLAHGRRVLEFGSLFRLVDTLAVFEKVG
jgi:hypothetical protein